MSVSSLVVLPSTVALLKGQRQQFRAEVYGSGHTQKATWTATAGTIDATGVFIPPALTTSPQTITITATSVDDGSKTATATVSLAARNGNRSAEFTATTALNGQTMVPVTIPVSPGKTGPVTVTIDEYTLTIKRGQQALVPQDVKTHLQNIGVI